MGFIEAVNLRSSPSLDKKPLVNYIDKVTFRLNEGCVDRPVMDRVAALIHRRIRVRLTYKALTKELEIELIRQ